MFKRQPWGWQVEEDGVCLRGCCWCACGVVQEESVLVNVAVCDLDDVIEAMLGDFVANLAGSLLVEFEAAYFA